MTLRVEWVRYGRPAADALRRSIAAAKAGDPLAPVTVVVPSNHVGVGARRLLASGALGPTTPRGHGIAAVSFLTAYRLAELLGAARLAGRGRRPVSTPVVAAAVRAALRAQPGVFSPVSEHPATEMALVAAYQELRDLSAAALTRLAGCGPRAADVVRIHHATRARLDAGFFDEEDLVGAACDRLREDGGANAGLGAVIVYLPQRLTRHGTTLLRAAAEGHDVQVLAGSTGDADADRHVRGTVLALDPASPGPPLAPADAGRGGAAAGLVSVERTRIVTASDADEEVRAAVRVVIDAVRAGTPLDRVAILYGTPEPYARLVDEHLAAASIARNGAAVAPLSARLAGRALLGLLALPAADYRRADVLAWLAGAPVRDGGRPVPVARWERISRDAGVVAGRAQWDHLLATYADDRDAEASQRAAEPETPDWLPDRLRGDAAAARGLRRFALALIDDLAVATATRQAWADRAGWAARHLRDLLGGEGPRSRWPVVEQRAAERTEQALDRLACLDALDGPATLDVFTRTLACELDADLGRVGRIGDGVLAGTVGMGVGLDLDLVVVLGLAEGSFPAPVVEDSLLPDEERAAAGGQLALRSEETGRRHHELLATLAGATRQVLCLPRGDLRRSSERVPSRWVTDIAGTLAGARLTATEVARGGRPGIEHVPSFDAGLRAASFPATEQEHRLRDLLAADPARASRGQLAGRRDPVLEAGAEAIAARRSPRFTRFDGNLAGAPVPSPVAGVTAATRLERWATCPFAYFASELLHVDAVENPEDRLQISPLDLGALVHEILERFVGEVLERPPGRQPRPEDAWTALDERRLAAIAGAVCDRYEQHGLVGRPLFWRRDRRRILADLARLLRDDATHRSARRTRPVAAELAFGMPRSPTGPVSLPLPDGRDARFRGRADRLDVAEDGTLEVLDYKTGRAEPYRELTEDSPDARGRRLQLVVYALAARLAQHRPDAPVRAAYWFVTGRGGFRRIGYPVTPDVLARVSATVGRIVGGIEAGVFPPYPTAVSSSPFVECPYCDPDGLGVADLRHQLDRKRSDAALAPFLDLAEGPAGGDTGTPAAGSLEAPRA